jgi:thymidylate synthase ThyX
MKPSAKIILDSISEQGHRLTTMEVVMHRFVLAEMNTHRVFSRNSASSRAIPYQKIRNRVVDDLAWPVKWGAEQRGMQSGDSIDDKTLLTNIIGAWRTARESAVFCTDLLHEFGLHKSLINRLLEPFMWHTAIITATEWDNFFWQRCHPDAQPEMKAVADEMQRAYYTSTPKKLAHGEWHLPYIKHEDRTELDNVYASNNSYMDKIAIMKRVSTARCARVSYLTHDGTRAISEDIALFNRLKGSGHWSPFEHVATPMKETVYRDVTGNFHGWKQFRKEFNGENRTNFVPNLPDLVEWLEQRRVRSMDEPMPESIKSFPHLDRMSQGGE